MCIGDGIVCRVFGLSEIDHVLLRDRFLHTDPRQRMDCSQYIGILAIFNLFCRYIVISNRHRPRCSAALNTSLPAPWPVLATACSSVKALQSSTEAPPTYTQQLSLLFEPLAPMQGWEGVRVGGCVGG